MIEFKLTATGIDLEYDGSSGFGSNDWVRNELAKFGEVRISKAFSFRVADVRNPPTAHENLDDFQYAFQFGTFVGDYLQIPGRVLESKNDVLISRDVTLKRKYFVAERHISIFGRLSELLEHSDAIVIGGIRSDAIPWAVYEELLKKFPNTYELDRYAAARVHSILSQHVDGFKDARGRYEIYLKRKFAGTSKNRLDLDALKNLEIEKYILIRDLIADALSTKKDCSEGEWQQLMLSFLLLLFPKYIKVLENVTISDHYSDSKKVTPRYLDIALIDVNGNMDVIEIKKPFDDKILRKGQYRGNSVPTSELSGSIMQAEKYLFHLSKWGVKGERLLTERYGSELPSGMKIRISNPKAIVIVGRDQIGGSNMNEGQLLDFEIVKRKYANMMDIITYDDLLRRLNNTITALGG